MALIHPDRMEPLAIGLERVLMARGIPRSLPIAFQATPDPDAVGFALALFRIGRPLVPLHSRWTEVETNRALALLPEVSRVSAAETTELLERARQSTGGTAPATAREDLAAIVFTSGSNGDPKPVALERGAFEASARASAHNLGWRDDDRWLLALPFAHVGGLSILTRTSLAGRAITLCENDPEAILAANATLLSVVPAQLHRMLELDRHNRLARLRCVLVGGAEFPCALREEARLRGIVALGSYGLTETCSQIATQSPLGPRETDSLDSGRALHDVEIRIAAGHVQVRGPMLMRGYVGAPRLSRDEFFTTGDLGSLDQAGRLYVTGRADDLIVTGGENVHPVEVERALSKSARVKSALCFGIPDPRWGEIVAVALVLHPSSGEPSGLESELRELAPFKRPRRCVVVSALPLGPTGKPDRRRARKDLARETRPWPSKSEHDTM